MTDWLKKLTTLSTSTSAIADIKKQNLKPAAVLILLLENQQKILLTKRKANLNQHAGQIAFPGGKFDEQDGDLKTTAIRETVEEIGLNTKLIQKPICLPAIVTLTGFHVTPFLASSSQNLNEFKVNQQEVELLLPIASDKVFNPKHYQAHSINYNNQQFKSPGFYIKQAQNQHLVWGATAKILHKIAQDLN